MILSENRPNIMETREVIWEISHAEKTPHCVFILYTYEDDSLLVCCTA